MIYFFDVNHELVKVVTSENIITARHEQELNGIIISDIELNLSYTKSFIEEASLFGYYYKGIFYLHNIQRVEDFHGDDLVSIHGRHIFFNDMQYGKLIEDVRPTDRNAYDMLAQTIETNTRWSLDFHATTGRLSTNFYWKTPYEVLEWIVNNFRLEYEPRILFDGKQINGYMLHINNSLGSNTGIRIPYGDRVLNLTHDVDYSEVITRLAPRGRGELLEGGSYGRRINIKDVDVNQDGIVSPIGDYYLEDTNISHQYESDRHAEIIFEDIEDVNALIEEGISAYQDMSRPKMNFEADVQDIGEVNIGDSVAIIRHEYEIYFNARVHMITVDLMNESDAQVELGDYEHFRESKSERAQRRVRENLIRESERFDREVQQMREAFEQALIDAQAEIDAIDERMATEIANEIASFETEFNAEVQAAKDLAQQQIADTEQRITTTIDTTRNEMENEFDTMVANAREYAEQQAEQHAGVIDTKLETMRGDHAGLIQQNTDNIANVNDFIGNQTDNLSGILQTLEHDFNQKIARETWHYNLLRGTQFDEGFWTGLSMVLEEDTINYFYFDTNSGTANFPTTRYNEEFHFEAGTTYRLSFDVQTHGLSAMNDIRIIRTDGGADHHFRSNYSGTYTNIPFSNNFVRVYIEFELTEDMVGQVRIGANLNNVGRHDFKLRRPYLTESENIQWLYHLDDNMQNLEEITMRVTGLETGFETLITRTEYNTKTGEIEGTVRSIEDTVDGVKDTIQNHKDWIATNGSSIERTVDGFDSKVWLSDIHNPNMIPFSDVVKDDSFENWEFESTTLIVDSFRQIARPSGTVMTSTSSVFSLVEGTQYTLSFEAVAREYYNSQDTMSYCYLINPESPNVYIGGSNFKTAETGETFAGFPVIKYTVSFIATETSDNARIMIGTRKVDTQEYGRFFFKKPKLEVGDRATPYYTAFSGLTQRVDEIGLLVQEIDGSGLVRQSDITVLPSSVRIGSTEILGDDVLASVLNVSPNAIDMITQKMRLSGDLYVDGDITALAISAVEGNFANLLASNIDSVSISADNITTGTLNAYRLAVNSVLVNRLFSNNIFAGEVTAKAVTAIEGNFARLFASEISTVNLNASNITTGTLASARLRVDNALINRLVANSILTGEMRSQSLTAVRGDIADLRTRILTTDVIKSTHLSSSNAMIDKMFANSALISRLTSKSAFISNIRAIDLEADQVRVGFNGISNNVTINSSGVTIDRGALTVNRTDGGAPTIISGSNPNGVHLVPSTPHRRDSGFTTQGQYAVRPAGGSYMIYDFYMFEWFYSDLMLDFAILNTTSSEIRVRMHVRGTDGSTFSREVDYTIPANTAIFPRMIVNLGVPDGSTQRFFIEARNVGGSSYLGSFGIHTYMVKHLDNGNDYPRLEFS